MPTGQSCGENRGFVPSKSCGKMLFLTVLCWNVRYVWGEAVSHRLPHPGPLNLNLGIHAGMIGNRTDVHAIKEIRSPFKNCPPISALAKIIRTAWTPARAHRSFDLQFNHWPTAEARREESGDTTFDCSTGYPRSSKHAFYSPIQILFVCTTK
jgi:hypothetical protein